MDQPAVIGDLPIRNRPLRPLGQLPQMRLAGLVEPVHLLKDRVPVDQRIERDIQMLRKREPIAGADRWLNVHAAHRQAQILGHKRHDLGFGAIGLHVPAGRADRQRHRGRHRQHLRVLGHLAVDLDRLRPTQLRGLLVVLVKRPPQIPRLPDPGVPDLASDGTRSRRHGQPPQNRMVRTSAAEIIEPTPGRTAGAVLVRMTCGVEGSGGSGMAGRMKHP